MLENEETRLDSYECLEDWINLLTLFSNRHNLLFRLIVGDFRIDLRRVCIFLRRCLICELNQGKEGLDGSQTVGIN